MIDGGCGCVLGRIEQMIRRMFWEAGVEGLVIGVSGGVDSAVAAALCVRAVGADRVLAFRAQSAPRRTSRTPGNSVVFSGVSTGRSQSSPFWMAFVPCRGTSRPPTCSET